jgi:hypothetical protein
MRLAGHTARMGMMENMEVLKEGDHLEDMGVDG